LKEYKYSDKLYWVSTNIHVWKQTYSYHFHHQDEEVTAWSNHTY
jgi:hypothetical protein